MNKIPTAGAKGSLAPLPKRNQATPRDSVPTEGASQTEETPTDLHPDPAPTAEPDAIPTESTPEEIRTTTATTTC